MARRWGWGSGTRPFPRWLGRSDMAQRTAGRTGDVVQLWAQKEERGFDQHVTVGATTSLARRAATYL